MKIQLTRVRLVIPPWLPLNKTILQATISITTVLMAVATLVSTPFMPTLAKMAVRAAKKADKSAYIHHMFINLKGPNLTIVFCGNIVAVTRQMQTEFLQF